MEGRKEGEGGGRDFKDCTYIVFGTLHSMATTQCHVLSELSGAVCTRAKSQQKMLTRSVGKHIPLRFK